MFQTRSTTSRSNEGSPSQPSPMAAAAAAAPLNSSADSANLDDDPNSSIIKKVRSRVSSILPDLSKWFSPTPSKRPRDTNDNTGQATPTGRNGNLLRLRRRESGSSGPDEDINQLNAQDRPYEEDIEGEESEDDADHAPPLRKKKRMAESFHTSFSDEMESPSGPSGLNISVIHRRSSLSSGDSLQPRSSGYSSVFSSSTPSTSPQGFAAAGTSSGLIAGRVQKTSTTVGFTALPRSPLATATTATKRFNPSNDETRVTRHRQQPNESLTNSIRHRRSIREVGNRKRLNILPMAVDRSTSEPPAPVYSGHRMLLGDNTFAQPAGRHSSDEEDLAEENPSRPISLHEEVEEKTLSNGNLNESASENSSVSNLNLSQIDSRRMSSFMGNARSKRFLVGGSTGNLCFSSHLETEKSLFSSKNAGRIGKPAFNASLYGSTSSLGSSHSSLFSNSPFYNGKTTYGGASAYSARRDIRQKALRVPVQMRPSSSLSNFSSSNASLASDTTALSNTAKRILEIMNQCSGPLTEARKLGSSLSINSSIASTKVPGLVQSRKRFNEEDLNVNRSIRMSSPRTPYSRPVSATGSGSLAAFVNKPPTAELLIPSQSQLLQMKRLQANTESVRRLATGSVGGTTLSEPSEYKLPTESDDSNNNVKHTSKIRSKMHRMREESSADRSSNTPVPQVNLPDVQLAGLKSVPKFDIDMLLSAGTGGVKDGSKATTGSSTSQEHLLTTSSSENDANRQPSSRDNCSAVSTNLPTPPALNNVYKFAAPSKLDLPSGVSSLPTASADSSFKFCEPHPIKTGDSNISTTTTAGSSRSTPSKITGFQYNPDMAKPKAAGVAANATIAVSSEKTTLPLKSGSCLDALKAPAIPPTLKTGSCLDVLGKQDSVPVSSTGPSNSSSTNSGSVGSFGSGFKLAGSNKWECDTCMVRNDSDKVKCVACDTPKPGSKPAQSPATNKFSFGSIPAGSIAPAADAGFKALVAQQSNRWECSDCLTRNDSSKIKCVCCDKAKPGATATPTAPAIPAVVQSMFAIPATSATSNSSSSSASVTTDKSFKALAAQQSANRWECSACLTRNDATRSKCVCCEQAKPGGTSADVPSFSFGKQSSTSSSTTTTSSSSSTATFSFGIPQKSDKNDTPKPTGFTFGGPASTAAASTTAGFSFGATSVASTSTTTSGEKPNFSFGTSNQTASSSPSSGFSFGLSKTSATDATDSGKGVEKKDEVKSDLKLGAGGFSFGAKPAVEEGQKSDTVTSTTTISGGFSFGAIATKPEDSSKPATGGFSFGKPTEASSAVVSTTTPTTNISSGTSGGLETKKPAVSFGTIASGTSSAGATSSFSFNSPMEKSVSAGDAKSTASAGTGIFSFGAPKPAATSSPSLSGQPASNQTKETGSPATANVPIFGGVQKPTGPSITPSFSFGSTATSSAATTSSTTGSPAFSFGGAVAKTTTTTAASTTSSNITATTSGTPGFVFGQNNQQSPSKVVPTFGSVASSAATSSDKPTFGTFGAVGPINPTAASVISNSIFGGTPASSSGFSFTSSAASSTAKSPESATPAFTFGSNKAAATTASAETVPAFGSTGNATPKSLFGSASLEGSAAGFGGGLGTTGTNVNTNSSAFGHVFGANSSVASSSSPSGSVFGQSASASFFGGAAAVTGGNTLGSAAPSFGSAPAGFGSVATNTSSLFGSYTAAGAIVPTGEEPLSKKPFKFGSNTGGMSNQAAGSSPFQFSAGTNNNNNNASDNSAKPFAFSAHSTPNFNFTAGSNTGQTSAPFTFGTNQSVPTAAGGVFNFGGGTQSPASTGLGGIVEAAPIAATPPFQFGASMPPQQNPFAATSLPGQNLQAAQRRKIRTATRRMTQR